MQTPLQAPQVLLKFVARTVLNHYTGGWGGDFAVDVLPAIAKDLWALWSKKRTLEQRLADLEAIVQASASEVRQQSAEIVLEMASDKPPEMQLALKTYLEQVPSAIRRSMRRPSDQTGRTVSPHLVPKEAADLLRLLPSKLPRFKVGDSPLPGVDLVLEELLGVGGFGEVWKARNPHMPGGPPVALKFCLDQAAAKELRNEAALLARVQQQGKHDGIVQLLDTYLKAEPPCLKYEYVDGGELTGYIREWHQTKGGPTPEEAAREMLKLAEIVGFAHGLKPKPIVHRDLKPANILLCRAANGALSYKVADFGIGGLVAGQALKQQTTGRSQTGLQTVFAGSFTPLYAAPQQMLGKPADPRDDVYALGVIWYQLLTGNLLEGAPTGQAWMNRLRKRGMTDDMIHLLASCIEADAGDRPADAQVLAERLSALMSAKAEAARQVEAARRAREAEAASRAEAARRAKEERQAEAERQAAQWQQLMDPFAQMQRQTAQWQQLMWIYVLMSIGLPFLFMLFAAKGCH